MAFWGVEVKPGRPFIHRVSDARGRLHLSQKQIKGKIYEIPAKFLRQQGILQGKSPTQIFATLGVGNAANKSIVQCNVGDKSPVFLCSLSPDKVESCQLNLEFEEAVEVIFSVVGPRSVHLTGYYINGNRNFIMDDDKSETYGEDIEDTEAEKSTSENDYDYSDSFINDGDPKTYRDSSVSDSDDKLTLKERADRKKDKKRDRKRGRLRKKHQVSDSDDDKNWKLGTFSGSDDSSTGDSLELPDSESEHEVQKFPSSKSASSSRHKKSEARGRSSLEMVETETRKALGGEDNNNGEVTNEREIKWSGNVLPSSDKEGYETLSKKNRKKEGQEGTVEGQQNLSDSAQNEKQDIDMGIKSSSNDLPSSKEEDCRTFSTKKGKKEGHEGSVEVISGLEGSKGEQNLSKDTRDEKQSSDGGIKPSVNSLPPSMKEGCETLSKKKRKKKGHEGTIEVNSGVEGGKSQQNLFEGVQNEKQAIDKGIEMSGNILPSSEQDCCGAPLRKKRKKEGQDGFVEVNSCVQRGKVRQNLSEHKENGEQAIDKNIEKGAEHLTDRPQTGGKTSKECCKVQDEGDNKLGDHPLPGKENIKVEVGDNEYRSCTNKSLELETLSNRVMIEELGKGDLGGKSAVKGKKVSIIYTGKLKENGQVFDSNVGKAPLRFRLGKGKVIEGLDTGIEGMQVGDKRRLIIPPSLGNAREGLIENVPVNAWLIYDVEAVKVR